MDAKAESGRELIYFRLHFSARRADGKVTAAETKIEKMMNFLFRNMAFAHRVEPSLTTDTIEIYTLRFKEFDVPSTSIEKW
jgi:hypothetical protein